MPDTPLEGRRILVVEDEYSLARDLCRDLTAAGATVTGPVASLDDAASLIEAGAVLDVAVLDINLGGELVYPVADALAARDVPFIFLTGYDRTALPPRFATRTLCEKPVEAREMIAEIGRAMA